MTTAKRLERFISDELLPGSDVSDPLAAGLLDSLAIEQLIAHIEERYDITFEDDEIVEENFTSLERLAELVDGKRGE
jgi:acyl carrier protein